MEKKDILERMKQAWSDYQSYLDRSENESKDERFQQELAQSKQMRPDLSDKMHEKIARSRLSILDQAQNAAMGAIGEGPTLTKNIAKAFKKALGISNSDELSHVIKHVNPMFEEKGIQVIEHTQSAPKGLLPKKQVHIEDLKREMNTELSSAASNPDMIAKSVSLQRAKNIAKEIEEMNAPIDQRKMSEAQDVLAKENMDRLGTETFGGTRDQKQTNEALNLEIMDEYGQVIAPKQKIPEFIEKYPPKVKPEIIDSNVDAISDEGI